MVSEWCLLPCPAAFVVTVLNAVAEHPTPRHPALRVREDYFYTVQIKIIKTHIANTLTTATAQKSPTVAPSSALR